MSCDSESASKIMSDSASLLSNWAYLKNFRIFAGRSAIIYIIYNIYFLGFISYRFYFDMSFVIRLLSYKSFST